MVVAARHLDLNMLRRDGWLFDIGTSHEPWYHFYTFFGEFAAVNLIVSRVLMIGRF